MSLKAPPNVVLNYFHNIIYHLLLPYKNPLKTHSVLSYFCYLHSSYLLVNNNKKKSFWTAGDSLKTTFLNSYITHLIYLAASPYLDCETLKASTVLEITLITVIYPRAYSVLGTVLRHIFSSSYDITTRWILLFSLHKLKTWGSGWLSDLPQNIQPTRWWN